MTNASCYYWEKEKIQEKEINVSVKVWRGKATGLIFPIYEGRGSPRAGGIFPDRVNITMRSNITPILVIQVFKLFIHKEMSFPASDNWIEVMQTCSFQNTVTLKSETFLVSNRCRSRSTCTSSQLYPNRVKLIYKKFMSC